MRKMKISWYLLGVLLLVVSCSLPKEKKKNLAHKTSSEGEKWISIFNGKNLEGWTCKMVGSPAGVDSFHTFSAEHGILKVSYDDYPLFGERFAHLFYREKLSDYKLKLDYRLVGKPKPDAPWWTYTNSGVMYHSQSPESMGIDQAYPVSLEMQILGCTDTSRHTTANICTPGTDITVGDSIYPDHCMPSSSPYFPDSTWISLELVVYHDSIIYHIVNGDTVLFFTHPVLGGWMLPDDYPDPPGTPVKAGYIALQAEGQPIEFRNIKLLKLK